MTVQHTGTIKLQDETRLNVASLLMGDVGTARSVEIELSRFPLDEELVAIDAVAPIRLTRLGSGVLANGTVSGHVEMECVRCLTLFEQEFSTKFAEEFHQTVDVTTGRSIPARRAEHTDDEDDAELAFEINDAHEIDMTELLRQWILLDLPMRPVCGDDCPGPELVIDEPTEESGEIVDQRFAALQELLDDEQD